MIRNHYYVARHSLFPRRCWRRTERPDGENTAIKIGGRIPQPPVLINTGRARLRSRSWHATDEMHNKPSMSILCGLQWCNNSRRHQGDKAERCPEQLERKSYVFGRQGVVHTGEERTGIVLYEPGVGIFALKARLRRTEVARSEAARPNTSILKWSKHPDGSPRAKARLNHARLSRPRRPCWTSGLSQPYLVEAWTDHPHVVGLPTFVEHFHRRHYHAVPTRKRTSGLPDFVDPSSSRCPSPSRTHGFS